MLRTACGNIYLIWGLIENKSNNKETCLKYLHCLFYCVNTHTHRQTLLKFPVVYCLANKYCFGPFNAIKSIRLPLKMHVTSIGRNSPHTHTHTHHKKDQQDNISHFHMNVKLCTWERLAPIFYVSPQFSARK